VIGNAGTTESGDGTYAPAILMNALAGAVWGRIPGLWSVMLAAGTECADVREGMTPNGIKAEPIVIRKAVRQD